MDAEQYIPSIFDEHSHFSAPAPSDGSKWAAVHEALENPVGEGYKSGSGSLFTMAWVLGITLGLIWVLRNGRTVLTQWQENVHRRASRRRHGIPDDDDRPFNVAYAAAALARREREQEAYRKTELEVLQTHNASQAEQHGLFIDAPQRVIQTTLPSLQQTPFIQGGFTSHLSTQPQAYVPVATTSKIQPRKSQVVEPQNWPGMYSIEKSHHVLTDIHEEDQPSVERRKHNQLDESDDEDRAPKKTRVDGGDLIDGDNDARWEKDSSHRSSLQIPKRGAKRQANAGDGGDWEMSQDKRARMGSAGHPDKASNSENVDMEACSDADGQDARGTKRGRDASDSTPDSAVEGSDESSHPRPTRKRRAAEKPKETVHISSSRRHKRDRSVDEFTTSDQDEDIADYDVSRRKRGRKSSIVRWDTLDTTDASESDVPAEISKDPACGGRRLGEIWEVNGQSFKVGLDGRRLRQALVKRRRSKFPMPRDSEHYDAKADLDVIVEKWLNDADYKAAKDGAELAWQDSPASTPSASEPKQQLEEPPASTGGKRLLLEGHPSPLKGRMSFHPVSVLNPFDLAPSTGARRSSAAHAFVNMVAESPKLRSSRSLSKWEKQELEAKSFRQLQVRRDAKEKAKEKEPVKGAMAPLVPSTNTQAAPAPVEKATYAIPSIFKDGAKASSTTSDPATTNASTAKPEAAPAVALAPTLSFTSATPAPSTIPSFKLSAPSTAPTFSPDKIPSLSFPSQTSTSSSAIPTSALDASKPQTSKPSFSFTSAPTGAPSGTVKPTFQTSFDKASSQPSIAATAPTPVPSVPSPFSFGPSAQAKPPTSLQQSPFAFGPSGGAQKPTEPSSAGSMSGVGGGNTGSSSLLSRLGPTAGSAPSSQKSAQNVSSNLFGGKAGYTAGNNTVDTDTSKANPSPFGGASSGTASGNMSAPNETVASAGNASSSGFSFGNNTTSPSPFGTATKVPSPLSFGATTNTSSPSPFGGFSGSKPSPFGFTGGNKPPTSTFGNSDGPKNIFEQGATKNTGQASSEPSKFLFGQPAPDSVKNSFGQPASDPAKSSFGQSVSEPAKMTFGQPTPEPAKNSFGQATSENTKSVFSSTPSNTSKNIFTGGSEATKNIFGQPATPTDAPKSGGIVFGKPSGATPSVAHGGTAQSQPAFAFSFGTSNPSSSNKTDSSASGTAPSPFGQSKPAFGQPSTFGQPPIFGQSSSTSQSSPFGQINTGSTSTTNSSPFSFSKPAEGEKK